MSMINILIYMTAYSVSTLFYCIFAKIKLDDADWTECPSLDTGMHKKSLEMSKKCLSPTESDPTRCNTFCGPSERRSRSEAPGVEHEEERLLDMEEEEDVDEEVAIDLSSSSKQQHPEAGSSVNPAQSPHRQSGGESDEQSWTLGESKIDWRRWHFDEMQWGNRRLTGSFRDDRNSQPVNRNYIIYLCLYIMWTCKKICWAIFLCEQVLWRYKMFLQYTKFKTSSWFSISIVRQPI